MRKGLIPLNAHAALEPLFALILIAAPWIFGFSDTDDATAICVVVGVMMLGAGMMTRWRMALVRVIPLKVHFMTDLALGGLLVISPLIFGFADEGGATRFMVIYGAIELLSALATRWDPDEAVAYTRSGHGAARV